MIRVGFAPLLCIVFILLKLFGAITWPWVMVVSPLWIGAILIALLLISVRIMNRKSKVKTNKYVDERQTQVFSEDLF